MSLERELTELRQPLLRFAQMQLRDAALSEDAVSETMLAILERPEQFEGRSSLRTYATGILKFKVIDILRRRSREVLIEPLEDQSIDQAIDAMFKDDGHWREPPQPLRAPDAVLEQTQFLQAVQDCVERLPPRLARVFMMREGLELETEAICSELEITANNCGVMLYRARMLLRECLNLSWFQGSA
jgi:RNA polymerase sigma-70 factor, ECF subfamily